jgi:hypothetical protein
MSPTCVAFVLALATAFGASTAFAQSDGATILTGKWVGEVDDSKYGRSTAPLGRTLVVSSATNTGGKWTVEAVYGITGRRLDPVAITVRDDGGGRLTLKFVTGAGSDVSLKCMQLQKTD